MLFHHSCFQQFLLFVDLFDWLSAPPIVSSHRLPVELISFLHLLSFTWYRETIIESNAIVTTFNWALNHEDRQSKHNNFASKAFLCCLRQRNCAKFKWTIEQRFLFESIDIQYDDVPSTPFHTQNYSAVFCADMEWGLVNNKFKRRTWAWISTNFMLSWLLNFNSTHTSNVVFCIRVDCFHIRDAIWYCDLCYCFVFRNEKWISHILFAVSVIAIEWWNKYSRCSSEQNWYARLSNPVSRSQSTIERFIKSSLLWSNGYLRFAEFIARKIYKVSE